MTIYIWFVVQQMYDSLTYPFIIVQYTLSHIVEHRKLDSLATPDNIVWSTVTSCWTNNVRQFDPSHALQSICKLSRNTFDTHFDKHVNHQCFVREEVSNSTVDLVNEFYEFEHLGKNIRYNLRLTTFYTTRDNALCTYLLQYLSNLIIGHEPGGGVGGGGRHEKR